MVLPKVSFASFVLVACNIEGEKTCSGISLKMMECYLILLTARLFAIVPFEGYLPFDRTGDWLYYSPAKSVVFLGR